MKMTKASLTLLFLIVCFHSSVLGLTSGEINPIENISVNQWTAGDGLSSNNITSVFQDSQGLIWITSFNGLMVYDGERFEIYDVSNLDILDTDGVYSTIEGPDGVIYIATQGSGILKYEQGEFSRFESKGETIPKSVRTIHMPEEGVMYIGTSNRGLYQVSNGVSSKIDYPSINQSTIVSIVSDSSDGIWIATEGQGLFKYDKSVFSKLDLSNGLVSNNITSLLYDDQNRLFIGTDNGLQIMNAKGDLSQVDAVSKAYINRMLLDDDQLLWLGGENGVGRWDEATGSLEWLSKKKGLDFVRISGMILDQEKNIWLSSNRSGLIQIKESQVSNLMAPELSSNRVYIVKEAGNKFYIGTDQNTIDICEGLKCGRPIRLKTDLKGNGVRDIYEDDDGSLWLATYVGIIHWDKGKETVYSIESGMPANNFRTVHKDSRGYFWFGSRSGGLVKFKDGEIIKVFSSQKGLESNFVLAVSESEEGKIYVGTHSGGMTIIDENDQTRTYHLKEDDSGLLLFNIDLNPDGTAKITANTGPINFDGQQLKVITLKSDFRSKTYFDIVDDNQGTIWITTNLGVLRVLSADWDAFLKGEQGEVSYAVLDDNQGMNNPECTGATRSTLLSDGNIMFPTLGGVCVVDPDRLISNKEESKVVLRKVVIDNAQYNVYDELASVPAGARRFSFYFSLLSYSGSGFNQYSYRLKGFEKKWSEASYNSQIEYTNLRPGKYTFEVNGCNENGVWTSVPATYSFTVEPFFYQTPWFYILLTLTVIAILFGVYKWRVSFINRRNVELKKVNAELDRFVYSASHELRSPLSSIMGLINVARHDTEGDKIQYFDYIEKSVKRLDMLIHDIIDYSKNSRQELHIEEINLPEMISDIVNDIGHIENFNKIEFELSDNVNKTLFNDRSRLKIALGNLITNAFKHHAPDEVENPFVKVLLSSQGGKAKIEVKDNGPGIEKQDQDQIFKMFYRATSRTEGTGIGLYIVAEIIEKMKGEIKLNSAPKKGAHFTVIIPDLEVQLEKSSHS